MTTTTAPTVQNQEIMQFELVDSSKVVDTVNDLTTEALNKSSNTTGEHDFVNTFICHLFFYAVFCVSIVLHILLDLGLGEFLKNKFIQFIGLLGKSFSLQKPAFA